MMQTISIKVSGKVQGVFYRQSTKEKALSLGIKGHVQNMPDGSVYIVATAEQDALVQLLQYCYKGPSGARVTNIETAVMELQLFDGFVIIRK
ncbi:MAG TPA: acylphosphatase [Panacibacter sp.]|nr:acylphosphatase [Panacibacter sp.]HNP44694.1 acylphosphatase [Panacibacter sp.]